MAWLSRQLGHSSIEVTVDLYGHWERSAHQREVAKVEASPSYVWVR